MTPDGVLGALCVAGGADCVGKDAKGGVGGMHASNVLFVAELLAESLLRRTAEQLLDVRPCCTAAPPGIVTRVCI